MEIGIGLPNTLAVPGPSIVDWSRQAEARGFSALATIDRIVYPTFDSLTVLAAAAGATSRIGLFTDILLTPLYQPVWLAKATASLDAVAGGRLTLGLGVGGRADDYVAMDRPMRRRGQLMDATLDLLYRAWAGEPVAGGEFPVGPPTTRPGRVPVLIGGSSDQAVERTIRRADGWTAGGGGPDMAAPMIERIRQEWKAAGREGEPRFAALHYFGFGDDDASRAALRTYYGFLGEWTEAIVESAVRTPEAAAATARAFADIGMTELMFIPTVGTLDQVDRLADAVL